MKKVAITQSNYIPWKGYFDLINTVDEFILFDEMQYTKRDWRNRNLIKTPQGTLWLSVPVQVKGKYLQKINETEVTDQKWREKHWKSIEQNYKKAKYFEQYREKISDLYLNSEETFLTQINFSFLTRICNILEISTPISFSKDYGCVEGKNERLIDLCKKAHGTHYYSGPAAKNYLDEKQFASDGVTVTWFDYSNYPEYNQLHPPFQHGVTILDLIFNEGPNSQKYMKSFCYENTF